MEYPVSLQLLQLGSAVLFGAGLGVHYDFLRALRRWLRALTVWLDLWFGASSLLACCLFCFYVGQGQFHFFMILGTLAGSLLYFLTLSPHLLRLLCLVGRLIGRLFHFLLLPAKKIHLFLKKVFSFLKKRVILFNKYMQKYSARIVFRHSGGVNTIEVQKVVSDSQADRPDHSGLRHGHAGFPTDTDLEEKRRCRRAGSAGSTASAGKRSVARKHRQSGNQRGHRRRRPQ